MTSLSYPDVSLYELILNSEHPPKSLQISPTIFKTMVGSLLDLLIEQQIQATLWVKLPKGEVWQSEINRFREAAIAPYTLYVLSGASSGSSGGGTGRFDVASEMMTEPQVEVEDEPALVRATHSLLQATHAATAAVDRNAIAGPQVPAIQDLSLEIGQQLKREYFILILSADFSGLLLAQRPRTSKAGRGDRSVLAGEEMERKHPLLALCSFEPPTIRRAVEGIYQAVELVSPAAVMLDTPVADAQLAHSSHANMLAEIKELLDNWENLTALEIRQSLNPAILSDLFTRQIHNLEEVWHSSATYRRQAESLPIFQMNNEELQASLRQKDEFLKNVGQELRTPLSTMKTALKLLNSPNLRANQRQRYMDMLEQECDRQSSLITSVLDLIQLETTAELTSSQPMRIVDVVPGVVSTYQPLAQEKGILLAYNIPEELPPVSCSSPMLRQVMINLLHNGIKFTPSGGQVWVRARLLGKYIQIEVEDSGIGIAPTDLPRVFERFYRIRHGGEESGAGLGLSIVQQIVVRAGGSITVKSEPGEGTTFTVLLPVYSQ